MRLTAFDRAIYAMTTVRFISAYDAEVLLRTALKAMRETEGPCWSCADLGIKEGCGNPYCEMSISYERCLRTLFYRDAPQVRDGE